MEEGILALTEGLILALDFGREKGCRGHCLFYALQFIGLVADYAGRNRVVALLDGAGARNGHIEHRSLIAREALLFRLVQSI